MTAHEFTCFKCGRECETPDDWSEEEANEEEKALFGFNSEGADRASLCDDCYSEFIQYWVKKEKAGDA